MVKRASQPEQEQRSSARQAFITVAWYKRIDDAAANDEEGVARSCDVSEDGAGMVTAKKLPIGAYLFLDLIAGTSRISLFGRVMHCAALSNGHFRIGIQIQGVPPTCRLAWQRLVEP